MAQSWWRKHREVLFVGRLLDGLDKEIVALVRSGRTFTQRAQNPGPSLDNP